MSYNSEELKQMPSIDETERETLVQNIEKDLVKRSSTSESMGSTPSDASKRRVDFYRAAVDMVDMALEALKFEPNKRSEIHLESIFIYLNEFDIFEDLSHQSKMNLCGAAKYRQFEVNRVIINENEPITSLYFLMTGTVSCSDADSNEIHTYNTGEYFGLPPNFSNRSIQSKYTYRVTNTSCAILEISSDDYNQILADKEEIYANNDMGTLQALYDGDLIAAATPEKLIDTLFDDKYSGVEASYITDFFLIYKMFIHDNSKLVEVIKSYFKSDLLKQRVVAVLINWITYCPEDFNDPYMQDFLEFIISQTKNRFGLAEIICQLLADTCLAYEFSFNLEETQEFPLKFKYRNISNVGCDPKLEMYITHIDPNSEYLFPGLKLYDEVILLNDLVIKELSLSEIRQLIKSSNSFIIIIKHCLIKYNCFKTSLVDVFETKGRQEIQTVQAAVPTETKKHSSKTARSRQSLFKSFTIRKDRREGSSSNRVSMFIPPEDDIYGSSTIMTDPTYAEKAISYSDLNNMINSASSSRLQLDGCDKIYETPKNNHFGVRIYNIINDCKFYFVSRTDTCKKIVQAMLIQNSTPKKGGTFGGLNRAQLDPLKSPSVYLFLVKLSEGGIKMSRLYDTLKDVPSMMKAGQRLYIARSSTEIKITKDIEEDLQKEIKFEFLDMEELVISQLLTLTDFYYFTRITTKEFLSSTMTTYTPDDIKNLTLFEERCNHEYQWTIWEVLNTSNVKKRAKMISKFIMIAKYCIELGNYNSFYLIISALQDKTVERLKTTWELVPQKMMKLFNECEVLCNPKNNMSAYRDWLVKCSVSKMRLNDSIIVPLVAALRKDIFFMHESHKTYYGPEQVNYYKMRMIAKELRKFTYFRNPKFTIVKAFETKYRYQLNIFEKPSLLLRLKMAEDNSIMLSNISADILNFVHLEKSIRLVSLVSTGGPLAHCDKKYIDEFITLSRVRDYIKTIETIDYNYDDLRRKSYSYDAPPKFILDDFNLKCSSSPSRSLSVTSISMSLLNIDTAATPATPEFDALESVTISEEVQQLGSLV